MVREGGLESRDRILAAGLGLLFLFSACSLTSADSSRRTQIDNRGTPGVQVRLAEFGLPAGFFEPNSDRCRSEIIGYRFVAWLGDEHVVVGFNLSPSCRGANGRKVDGLARLLVFDKRGRLTAQRDLPYLADGYGELVAEGEAGPGPAGTILFRMQSVNLDPQGRSESPSSVLLLDADLREVKRIDQFLEQTTFVNHSLVFNDGKGPNSYLTIRGLDASEATHWERTWPTGTMDRRFGEHGVAYALCEQELRPGEFVSTNIVYAGAQRRCNLVVENDDGESWSSAAPVSGAISIVGTLADGAVVGQVGGGTSSSKLLRWSKDGGVEDLPWVPAGSCGTIRNGTQDMSRYLVLASKGCSSGQLYVFDRQSREPLVESAFAANARADLSTSGSHYATFESGELRIYAVPSKPPVRSR